MYISVGCDIIITYQLIKKHNMKDNQIRYRQRKFAGRKDRVSFSARRFERNVRLIIEG